MTQERIYKISEELDEALRLAEELDDNFAAIVHAIVANALATALLHQTLQNFVVEYMGQPIVLPFDRESDQPLFSARKGNDHD